ncbi:MAG: flagellar FliJ family protein [Chloroflexi bacterium]|nr:flagellar FliJ family protein [Chloroflexota bacterium]
MAPKFSLQNVLDIRHGKVEILEIEFGKLLSAHQQTQALLLSLQEFQADLFDQLGAAQLGEIDLMKINLIRQNILQGNKRIESVALELKKQTQEIKDKRTELVKAKQSEETLEILKENRHQVYMAEQVQIESRALDDIYIARAFRNQQRGA